MRLRRSSASEPGIARRRRGRGFSYVDQVTGRPVDSEVRARVESLVIPPAWRDVWICRDAHGHLQATGTDDAGRLQYLYHAQWRVTRDEAKFERMLRFAELLPAARRRVARHLRDPEATRRRALACAFRILDLGCLRVGSEQYARKDGGIGLATLRCGDVSIDGPVVHLAFRGKSGVAHDKQLRDARLASALEPLASRPRSTELLAYRLDDGWHDVRSADINAYVHEVVGDDFTTKDFRTWRATVTATDVLRSLESPSTARAVATARSEAAKAAADELGNTPTVARNAYIDPRVFEEYAQGHLEQVDGSPETVTLEVLGSAS